MIRPRPRILVFAGSIRTGSHNARLAAQMVQALALKDAEPTLLSLGDYAMPLYDADLEAASGVPDGARRLAAQMTGHTGIFIASPEYNASVPPLLKNAIDWVSRIRAGAGEPSPWRGRVYALGSASPGAFAGIRSLMHLRQVLELGLGATVIPEQISVPSAATAFAGDGGLADERLAARLETVASRLIDEAARYVA
ncbi:NADPH-dependent FMN reductase [Chthonobacter rhizosphaerae]|uniref:NADPH-dependent FMN reductase n=1 Tax=Chthonobacter rhizosphaerae TaxID=2735553 RepID=UPI0015EF29B4|nr:NAD(P)H-dependent oxidoreductase [Chthonobacter rhizosphaerae]